MYVEHYGDANNPSILFLHGAMAFHCFMKQIEISDKFHLIFYTLPGHGQDSQREFDRETALKEAVQIAKSLNKGKINLVGFSLGSQLGLKLIDGYSNLFDKAVLVSPLIDSTEADEMLLSISTRIVGYSTKFEPISKFVSMFMGIDRDKYPQFVREQKSQNVDSLSKNILKDMLISDNLKNIGSLQNEVLLLAGGRERSSFRRSAKKLNGIIKNSELKIYEGAGHNIPFKFYKQFNSDLIKFFSKKGE